MIIQSQQEQIPSRGDRRVQEYHFSLRNNGSRHPIRSMDQWNFSNGQHSYIVTGLDIALPSQLLGIDIKVPTRNAPVLFGDILVFDRNGSKGLSSVFRM